MRLVPPTSSAGPPNTKNRSDRFLATCVTVVLFASLCSLAFAQESFLVTTGDVALTVFDMATLTPQKVITAGYNGTAITVGANPRLAFVLTDSGFLDVVDLTIGREIKKIYNVGGLWAALTTDGKTLLAWDEWNGTLDVLDVASLSVTRRVNLAPAMGANANSGGNVVVVGKKAFLASIYPDQRKPLMGVVDLDTFQVTAIPIPYGTFEGVNGNAVATPDGKYVAIIEDEIQQGSIYVPELLLVDTTTYAVTAHPFTNAFDPHAIVVNPNKADPNQYFGYMVGVGVYDTEAVAVDFRPASPTYGEVISNEAPLQNLSFSSVGSPLGISSDGKKLIVPGYGVTGPNLVVLDTNKILIDPEHAVIVAMTIAGGNACLGVAVGSVMLTPPNPAPTVTSVEGSVTNDMPTEITVSGTNFVEGAQVRIGGMPLLNASVDNGSSLRVTVPVNAPAGAGLDIIVTNPQSNSPLDQQQQSGLLAGQFKIAVTPSYQPRQQFASLNYVGGGFAGSGIARMFDLNQRNLLTLQPGPIMDLGSLTFSADGATISGANLHSIGAWDTATGQVHGQALNLPTTLAYHRAVPAAISPLTGRLVMYAVLDRLYRPHDLLLSIVDADPNSPQFNTVIGEIPAGLQYQYPVRANNVLATPDGKYVYAFFTRSDNYGTSHIAIYDVVHGTASIFQLDLFYVDTLQQQPTISPEGKWLVLRGRSQTYSRYPTQLKVFDIFTDPMKPRLVGIIKTPRLYGNTYGDMLSYQVAGNHLFVLNRLTATVCVFNFSPQKNDYRLDAIYRLPGNTNHVYVPMVASADGNYLYVALAADSMIAVLDTGKLAVNRDPLVTTIADSDSTHFLATSPVPPPAKFQPGKQRKRLVVTPPKSLRNTSRSGMQ